jgi:hypothetical protein
MLRVRKGRADGRRRTRDGGRTTHENRALGWTVQIVGRQNVKRQATIVVLISSIDSTADQNRCKENECISIL